MNLQMVIDDGIEGAAEAQHADRDHDLLNALRCREPLAAETLAQRYGDRAFRLASRITGNREDAEEVVQDAFWAVVRKIDSFRDESAFGSWLYRIVANAAYQTLRRRERRRHDVSLDDLLSVFDEHGRHVAPVVDWSAGVNDPGVRAEVRVALIKAIEDLPVTHQTLLVLRDVEGRSNLEIAEAVGVSIQAVRTRVHRVR